MRHRRAHRERGAVAVIVLLVLIDLIIVAMVLTGGRDHDLTVRRMRSVEAFYAAEAGMNMALREVMRDEDEDGDGEIGTISDNGADADDPVVGGARVTVMRTIDAERTTLFSRGRAGEARRWIEAVLE